MARVQARTGGGQSWVVLGPPGKHPVTGVDLPPTRTRVSDGEVVNWLWPILKPDDPDFDPSRRLPRGWLVMAEDLDAEFAMRVAELKKTANPDKDPYKERLAAQDVPEEVIQIDEGNRRDLILAAVAELEPGNQEHFAGKGPNAKPRVNAVQLAVEKMVEEESGSREWPAWITRKSIDTAVHEAGMSGAD